MAVKRRSSRSTPRPAPSDASFVRCASGQCQNDASKSSLGYRVRYGPLTIDGVVHERDYVVPVCPRCQVIASLITKTPLVAYHPPPVSESVSGGENDMVMVGGKLRQRRAPRKSARLKVA